MSKDDDDEVQKYFSASQLSYENKTCSECQHDVGKHYAEEQGQGWKKLPINESYTVFPRFNRHVVESEIRRNLKKCFSSINDTSLTPGEITTPVVNHGEEEEVDNTGLSLFSDSFFRPTSEVSISEMVYPNYLKFDVRIVLYQVPFQIKFEVILTNGYRDIDLGSWPKKRSGKMQTICR